MGLIVESPGVWTTVQDLGRSGHRGRGVPVSGAFDRAAHVLANALLGNPADSATLELTLIGGTYRAERNLALALFGAPMKTTIARPDGSALDLQPPQTFTMRPDDRVILGGSSHGARAYLAVRGGWQTPILMGSRSRDDPLRAGDRLPATPSITPARRPASLPTLDADATRLRILAGADGVDLPPAFWDSATFIVGSRSDRMGLRLDGPSVDVQGGPDRLSTPVAPGALQVAGNQLILLGPACGTMGGYPVVAHVISADLDRVAQVRPGDPVGFTLVEAVEARRWDRARRHVLEQWACRWRVLDADDF